MIGASRSISSNESTTIRPTPDVDGAAQLGSASCCCRGSRSGPGRSRPAARRSARRPSRRRGRAPPRRPSARPRCRGTPCRRRRRRTPRTRRGRRGRGPGSRPRRGRTPGCCARRPGRAPPGRRRRSSPSTLCAVCDHRCGTRALGSAGSRSQDGPRMAPGACAQPASWRHRPSHPLGGGDAEQAEAVGEHRAGGSDRAPGAPR